MMKWVKRIGIGVGLFLAALVAIYLVVVFWHGSTKPILAVANKFEPPSSWRLVSEDIEPPRIMCGEVTIKCPRVSRTWQGGNEPLSTSDFEAMIRSAGWQFPIDNNSSDLGATCSGSCYAEGDDGKYSVMVAYTSPRHTDLSYDLLITVTLRN